MPPDGADPSTEIYVEFIRQGGTVKVTAIDAATGAEASIIGPAHAAPSDLQTLAIAKLRALVARRMQNKNHPTPARRGIVV